MTHRSHGVRAQRTLRALAARIAAAALATAVLVTGAPSAAVAGSATPTPTPTSTVADAPTVVVTPLGRGLIAKGEALTASVSVTNTTDADREPAPLSVQVGAAPLESRSALDAWIAHGVSRASFDSIESRTLPAIARNDAELTTVTIAPDDPLLTDRAPGTYPLVATYNGGVTARSVVTIYDPAGVEARPTTIVLPITAGARSTGLLSSDELLEATSTEGRLTALLDGIDNAAGETVVLAIDPAIVASIRVLGARAPESALVWLERLEQLPHERFALQFGDADVAAQVAAELAGPLGPTSLDYALSAEDFVAQPSTPQPSPTPAPDPDAPVELPGLEELLEIPGARENVFWPADGATDATIAGLAAWTGGDPDAVTIASSAWTVDPPETIPSAVRAVNDARVLVYDETVGGAMSEAASATTEAGTTTVLPVLSAQLAIAGENATTPVLITPGRLENPTAFGVRAAIATIAGMPSYEAATLDELTALAPSPLTFATESNDERIGTRADELHNLLRDEADVDTFASILDDPALLVGAERTAVLQLIGAAWAQQADEWPSAIENHRDRTQRTLDAVQIQRPTRVLLTTPDSGLPFYIRNDLPWPVNVVLLASPDDLRLDIERTTTWTLPPGVNTRVEVPVKARVGSGDVSVELRLVSPTSQIVGPIRTVDVVVRADWERIGLGILGAIVGLLLLVGLVRTILRRRRRRRRAEAAADSGSTTTDSESIEAGAESAADVAGHDQGGEHG